MKRRPPATDLSQDQWLAVIQLARRRLPEHIREKAEAWAMKDVKRRHNREKKRAMTSIEELPEEPADKKRLLDEVFAGEMLERMLETCGAKKVLELVLQGLSATEIGEVLGLDVRTAQRRVEDLRDSVKVPKL